MFNKFLIISVLILAAVGVAGYVFHPWLWAYCFLIPLFILGLFDSYQTHHAIRRNFPVIGNLRYFFEMIRPELQQYFVESNHSGRPVSRELRSIVYQRAKGQTQTLPFGTQLDVNVENYEYLHHSIVPAEKASEEGFRVTVGGRDCAKPYSASLLNISAMSFGSLSSAAVTALNLGAKMGGFYHNTGEGGLSEYHLQGGDVVWQIGTGYFGCRKMDGSFCEDAFKERARLDNVKMIEIKLSQGAKPGHGGILPGAKVSEEIAKIRLVEPGKTVVSPSSHSTFKTPKELLYFVRRLRELSGGKPVGFKLCVGRTHEFIAICKAMAETKISPDFITVDGAEGGTGAAPLEFSNHVGTPLDEGLSFVVDALRGFDLKKDIRVIASGKVFTSFHILTKLALGADMVNSARAMMLSLGCIQALRCNTNQCPTGVATSDPRLVRGLHVPSKAERVAHFQRETVKHLHELVMAVGYDRPSKMQRRDVTRRLTDGVVKSLEDVFPTMPERYLLDEHNWKYLNSFWQAALYESDPESFARSAFPVKA